MEEQKRIYRYYDKINGKNVYLKVTDEVAKFLQNSEERMLIDQKIREEVRTTKRKICERYV